MSFDDSVHTLRLLQLMSIRLDRVRELSRAFCHTRLNFHRYPHIKCEANMFSSQPTHGFFRKYARSAKVRRKVDDLAPKVVERKRSPRQVVFSYTDTATHVFSFVSIRTDPEVSTMDKNSFAFLQ
jgi:hypothetical protein